MTVRFSCSSRHDNGPLLFLLFRSLGAACVLACRGASQGATLIGIARQLVLQGDSLDSIFYLLRQRQLRDAASNVFALLRDLGISMPLSLCQVLHSAMPNCSF